jgi:Leucine-rich repeat (LRR) protein
MHLNQISCLGVGPDVFNLGVLSPFDKKNCSTGEQKSYRKVSIKMVNCLNLVLFVLAVSRVSGTQEEESALLDLFKSTNGNKWTNNTNWGVGSYCEWHGVTCDDSGSVTILDLAANGLSGAIPSSISALSQLESLALSSNQLTGSLPNSMGEMLNLTSILLGKNKISGQIPNSFGNLVNLEGILLEENLLTGNIPTTLGNLHNLFEVDFRNNQLGGVFPSSLASVRSLVNINVANNQLVGTIPAVLSGRRMMFCDMTHNKFQCPPPAQLSCMTDCQSTSLNE